MDAVNLAVGIVAIVLALAAIFLSYKFSDDAARSLDKAQSALDEVKRETANITRAVEERLKDMIGRTMPSQEEQMTAQLLGAVVSGQLDMKKIEGLMKMAKQMEGKE